MSSVLVRSMVTPARSVRRQVANGVFWLAGGSGATAALGALKIAIIARLLSPTDFGLFGLALLFSGWVEHLTELGFRDALIRKQGEVDSYLDTVWTAQLLRGLAIAALVLAAAPLVAWYYDTAALSFGMSLVSINVVVRSLTNPATVHLRKSLDLGREVAWRISGPVAGLVSGVVLAWFLRNAWALFYALLIASVAQTVASYVSYPYRPRFRLARGQAYDLLRFGHQLFWLRIVGLVNWSIDGFVISKVLGLTDVGRYAMGARLARLTGTVIGSPLHGVMFPALSKVTDPGRQRAALVQTLTAVLAITMPLALSLATFAHVAVPIFLGAGWASIAAITAVQACFIVTLPLGNVLNAYFMARHRIDLDTRAAIGRTVMLLLATYPAVIYWGIPGVTAVVTLSSVVTVVYQLVLAARLAQLQWAEVRGCFTGGLVASLPLCLAWPFVPVEVSTPAIVVAVAVAGTALAIGAAFARAIYARPLAPGGVR